jgi:hypothetical protein
MLHVIVAVLAVALAVTLLLLWRAYRLIHTLESILADADDRVRALELKLLHARRMAP